MVKIRFMIIYNINTFTVHKTLFQNVINVLPIIYQNETRIPGKNSK